MDFHLLDVLLKVILVGVLETQHVEYLCYLQGDCLYQILDH